MLMSLGNKLCEYDCSKRLTATATATATVRCSQRRPRRVVNTGSCCHLHDFHFPECAARQGDLQLAANGAGGLEWSVGDVRCILAASQQIRSISPTLIDFSESPRVARGYRLH